MILMNVETSQPHAHAGEDVFRRMVTTIADYAICRLGTDGTVATWNAGAERIEGYAEAEILGQHFSILYDDQDRQNGKPDFALASAISEGRFEEEGWRVRKDGTKFWAHSVISALHDDQGLLCGFAKVERDVTVKRRTEGHLAEEERIFRLLVQSITDYAIYMLDPTGRVANWNPGAENAKGYTAREIIGAHFSCFYTEADRQLGMPQRALATALAHGKFEGYGWRLRRDGSRFWAHVIIDPVRDESGVLIGFAKITQDLTQQKQNADDLKAISDNLDLALSNMSQGLLLFDRDEKLVICNERLYVLLDLDKKNIYPGITFTDLLWHYFNDGTLSVADTNARVNETRLRHLADLSSSRDVISAEIVRRQRIINFSHRALPGGGWVSTLDDITERRIIEDQITHLAHHDPLTALPNRMLFQERLSFAVQGTSGNVSALLYMDLDRFKPVNDMFGHAAGDTVLRVVGERLQGLLRKQDLVSRLGGDEFAVLMPHCTSQSDALHLAERLIQEVSRPIFINEASVNIGVSIGIAFAPQHGSTPEQLLRNADLALYRAKENGRGHHAVYESGIDQQIIQRRELEQDLRAALQNHEFVLLYQPVVNTGRQNVTSCEALLRWISPTRGLIPPLDFIPQAEDIGLMPEIGAWVLRTACAEAMRWPDSIRVSVNVSPTQLRKANFLDQVMSILHETGLPPERLELEVTETAIIDDVKNASLLLHRLRARGIHVALDDFGTGYSSLSFLSTLPVTRIKIDRSFVQGIDEKPEAAAIVRAVGGICQSLGIDATAEGVETEQQAEFLESEGCPDLQGYLIRRPCVAEDIRTWIDKFQRGASDDRLLESAAD